jgi:hypothetical protein
MRELECQHHLIPSQLCDFGPVSCLLWALFTCSELCGACSDMPDSAIHFHNLPKPKLSALLL